MIHDYFGDLLSSTRVTDSKIFWSLTINYVWTNSGFTRSLQSRFISDLQIPSCANFTSHSINHVIHNKPGDIWGSWIYGGHVAGTNTWWTTAYPSLPLCCVFARRNQWAQIPHLHFYFLSCLCTDITICLCILCS